MADVRTTRAEWAVRPRAGAAVRFLALVVPVLLALASSQVMARLLPAATDGAAWWSLVLLAGLSGLLAGEQMARRLRPLGALLSLALPFPGSVHAPSRVLAALRRIDPTAPPAHLSEVGALVEAARRATASGDRIRRVHGYADLAAREAGADPDLLAWAVVLSCAGPWRAALTAMAQPVLGAAPVEQGLAAVAGTFDDLLGPAGGDGPDTLFAARRELAGRGGLDLDADAVRSFLAVPAARLRAVPGPSRLLVGTPLLLAVRGLGPAARPLGVATSGLAFVVIAALSMTAERLLPAVTIPTPFPTPDTGPAPATRAPDELAARDDAPAPVVVAAGPARPAAAAFTNGDLRRSRHQMTTPARRLDAVTPPTATPVAAPVAAAQAPAPAPAATATATTPGSPVASEDGRSSIASAGDGTAKDKADKDKADKRKADEGRNTPKAEKRKAKPAAKQQAKSESPRSEPGRGGSTSAGTADAKRESKANGKG